MSRIGPARSVNCGRSDRWGGLSLSEKALTADDGRIPSMADKWWSLLRRVPIMLTLSGRHGRPRALRPGGVPAIHAWPRAKTWMPGTRQHKAGHDGVGQFDRDTL